MGVFGSLGECREGLVDTLCRVSRKPSTEVSGLHSTGTTATNHEIALLGELFADEDNLAICGVGT